MSNRVPRQFELFSDGARAVAAKARIPTPRPTETDLQVKLEDARMRLHEIVILRMKTWLPTETLKALGASVRGVDAAAGACDRLAHHPECASAVLDTAAIMAQHCRHRDRDRWVPDTSVSDGSET
jgi:hypothetical protein